MSKSLLCKAFGFVGGLVGLDVRTKEDALKKDELFNKQAKEISSLRESVLDNINESLLYSHENRILRERLITDSLTKLYNRVHLHSQVSQNHEMAQDQRCEKRDKKALFLLDLDGFKTINDTHGHAIGDHVLRIFAERLSSVLRETDNETSFEHDDAHGYRVGGDEFAVIAHGCDEAGAEIIKKKIFSCVSKPIVLEDPKNPGKILSLDIGTSVGFCCYNAEGTDIDKFLGEVYPDADAALYKSKETKYERFLERDIDRAEAAGVVCRQIPLEL